MPHNNNKPPAFRQLREQIFRHKLNPAINQNNVERRMRTAPLDRSPRQNLGLGMSIFSNIGFSLFM